ncbi:MAG: hypothetical protein PVF17_04430 [Ignavibacteria bacterium]|jgi:hypothetical protein
MYKILFLVLFSVLTAKAGMFSTVEGLTMKEKKIDTKYTIDTNGFNPRVYEFTPVTQPKYTCIIVFSSSNDSSVPVMQCVRKTKLKEK